MGFIESIKKTNSFKTVYSCGRKEANAYFVMYALANEMGYNRLGLSISKKVGKAVVRNRIRRLVKESCRIRAQELISGYDIVVIARQACGNMPKEGSYKMVDKALVALFDRLRLLKGKINV